jgi:hypothetical protein
MKVEAANVCVCCDELVDRKALYCTECLSSQFIPLVVFVIPLETKEPPKQCSLGEVVEHWSKRRKTA